jgi:hypothetical protein
MGSRSPAPELADKVVAANMDHVRSLLPEIIVHLLG